MIYRRIPCACALALIFSAANLDAAEVPVPAAETSAAPGATSIPANDETPVKLPEKVEAWRAEFARDVTAADAERAERLAKLAKDYAAQLEALAGCLSGEGRRAPAMAARVEAERVKSGRKVVEETVSTAPFEVLTLRRTYIEKVGNLDRELDAKAATRAARYLADGGKLAESLGSSSEGQIALAFLAKECQRLARRGEETAKARQNLPATVKEVVKENLATLAIVGLGAEPLIEAATREAGKWRSVPAVLRGAKIYSSGAGKSNGVADFTVTKQGRVYVACNYDYQGNRSGSWSEERWMPEQFAENGWARVEGVELISWENRAFMLFTKELKADEKGRFRCNKYEPPYFITFQP